jgi:hypothetical protein
MNLALTWIIIINTKKVKVHIKKDDKLKIKKYIKLKKLTE